MAKARGGKILKFDAAGRGLSKSEILKVCDAQNVRFMRLQFTDIFGIIKNVEIPRSQFEKALDGEIQFDGSSGPSVSFNRRRSRSSVSCVGFIRRNAKKLGLSLVELDR